MVDEPLKRLLFAGRKAINTITTRETITQPFKNPTNPPPILFRNPNPEMPKSFPTTHPIMWAQRIHATKMAMKLITLAVPGREAR